MNRIFHIGFPHHTITTGYFFLLMASLTACRPSTSSENHCADNIMMPDKIPSDLSCNTLLVIAEDRSGSTGDIRKFNSGDFTKIIDHFREHFSGEIAIRVIGNPADSQRQFFRLSISPPFKHIEEKEDARMSEKGLVRCQNLKIDALNDSLQLVNQKRSSDFIAGTIHNQIEGYKPDHHRNVTNIEDPLQHIASLVDEVTYRDYRIEVLLVSDGIHTAYQLVKPLTFAPGKQITLFTIGWKDDSVFSSIADKHHFESIEGFMSYFTSLTCSHQ